MLADFQNYSTVGLSDKKLVGDFNSEYILMYSNQNEDR